LAATTAIEQKTSEATTRCRMRAPIAARGAAQLRFGSDSTRQAFCPQIFWALLLRKYLRVECCFLVWKDAEYHDDSEFRHRRIQRRF
jgi:hypothetical protein